jgi:hypothetical protein
MKKLFVLFVIVAFVAISCGRVKNSEATTEQDTTAIEIVDTLNVIQDTTIVN